MTTYDANHYSPGGLSFSTDWSTLDIGGIAGPLPGATETLIKFKNYSTDANGDLVDDLTETWIYGVGLQLDPVTQQPSAGTVFYIDRMTEGGAVIETVRHLSLPFASFAGVDNIFTVIYAGNDFFTGYADSDTFMGGAGSDAYLGGGGTNWVSYANATPSVISSTFGVFADLGNAANNDSVASTQGATASLDAFGDRYNNIVNLVGSAYDDTLRGSGAANTLVGGEGNDVLRGAGAGDFLDGGAGTDFADYGNVTSSIKVDLSNSTNNTTSTDAAGDTYSSIEGIITGTGNDTLVGDANTNFLRGGVGADSMDGGLGNDYADYRGATTGVLVNLAISSQNTGEAAGDVFTSIEGIRGSLNFADYLVGDGNDNYFRGLGGADTLDGAAGSDWAEYYSTGYNSTSGVVADLTTPGNNTGDAAGDVYISIESLRGTLFADTLRGDASDNKLKGESGNDTLDGAGGNDTAMYTGSQSDYTITYNANGTFTIEDHRTQSSDGTDTLTSIEFVQFQTSGNTVGLNQPPVGAPTAVLTACTEDTPYVVSAADLLQGFSDGNGDTLAIASLTASNGTVVNNGNGTYTITPTFDFNGAVTLTYAVADGQGGVLAAQQQSYTIAAVNDAPVVSLPSPVTLNEDASQTFSIAGDRAIIVSDNDALATGPLTVTLSAGHGTLSLSGVAGLTFVSGDGAADAVMTFTGLFHAITSALDGLVYAPDLNYDGLDGLVVTVADNGQFGAGGPLTTTSTLALTIAAVNDAPVVSLTNVVTSTPENSIGFKVADIVVTDDALGVNGVTLSGDDAASFFIQNVNELWFAGNADYETKSSYAVRVEVDDAAVGSSPDSFSDFTLLIGDVNEGAGDQTITGTAAGETLTGGSGNDSISGLAGNDLLIGGAGNDTLDGGPGSNTMRGGAGDDILLQPTTGVSTDAGLADYRAATGPIIANFSSANATVTGDISVGTDTLIGANQVAGTDFGDTFTATTGYSGANGTFTEFEGMGGDDTISGNGNTRVSYRFADAAVEVDLGAGFGRSLDPVDAANVGIDSFTGVNAVRGSAYADSLYGSNALGFEAFRGQGGNDYIDGRGGTDQVDYNVSPAGIVLTMTGAGSGTATDGYGTTDTFINIEQVRGSQHADFISADGGNNRLDGQGGNDTLLAGGGNDTFLGAGGNDRIDGGSGSDTLILTGNIADYNFGVAADGSLVLTDLRSGSPDGSDAVTGVETLQFSNGAVNLSGLPIDALYRHLEVAGSPTTPWFKLDIGGSVEPVVQTATLIVLSNFTSNGGEDGTETRINGTDLTYDAEGELTGGTVTSIERTNVGGTVVYETITHLAIPALALVGEPDLFSIAFAGNDLFIGWSGTDTFQGRAGSDTFIGFNGANAVSYENYVALSGTTSGVFADFGQNGTGNTVEASGDRYTNIGQLLGSAYDDTLRGGSGTNTLRGNDGNDILMGRDGADTLDGGSGFDTADYSNLALSVEIDLLTPANNFGGNGEATGDVYISIEKITTLAVATIRYLVQRVAISFAGTLAQT